MSKLLAVPVDAAAAAASRDTVLFLLSADITWAVRSVQCSKNAANAPSARREVSVTKKTATILFCFVQQRILRTLLRPLCSSSSTSFRISLSCAILPMLFAVHRHLAICPVRFAFASDTGGHSERSSTPESVDNPLSSPTISPRSLEQRDDGVLLRGRADTISEFVPCRSLRYEELKPAVCVAAALER